MSAPTERERTVALVAIFLLLVGLGWAGGYLVGHVVGDSDGFTRARKASHDGHPDDGYNVCERGCRTEDDETCAKFRALLRKP